MTDSKTTQTAPKDSKSSAQRTEVLSTSPYAFFEKKWAIDEDGMAHLQVSEGKDSEAILAIGNLLADSADGIVESYRDSSDHKRYRYHKSYFATGIVINNKTYWFGNPDEDSQNLMSVTRVNKTEQEMWSTNINLQNHINFHCYGAVVDYLGLAIEIWETIKANNRK